MNNSGLTTSVAGEGLGAGVGPAPGAGAALGAGGGAEKIGWPCKWKNNNKINLNDLTRNTFIFLDWDQFSPLKRQIKGRSLETRVGT